MSSESAIIFQWMLYHTTCKCLHKLEKYTHAFCLLQLGCDELRLGFRSAKLLLELLDVPVSGIVVVLRLASRIPGDSRSIWVCCLHHGLPHARCPHFCFYHVIFKWLKLLTSFSTCVEATRASTLEKGVDHPWHVHVSVNVSFVTVAVHRVLQALEWLVRVLGCLLQVEVELPEVLWWVAVHAGGAHDQVFGVLQVVEIEAVTFDSLLVNAQLAVLWEGSENVSSVALGVTHEERSIYHSNICSWAANRGSSRLSLWCSLGSIKSRST